jgi:hypothetical protein
MTSGGSLHGVGVSGRLRRHMCCGRHPKLSAQSGFLAQPASSLPGPTPMTPESPAGRTRPARPVESLSQANAPSASLRQSSDRSTDPTHDGEPLHPGTDALTGKGCWAQTGDRRRVGVTTDEALGKRAVDQDQCCHPQPFPTSLATVAQGQQGCTRRWREGAEAPGGIAIIEISARHQGLRVLVRRSALNASTNPQNHLVRLVETLTVSAGQEVVSPGPT